MKEQWIFYLDVIIPVAIFVGCILIIKHGNKE